MSSISTSTYSSDQGSYTEVVVNGAHYRFPGLGRVSVSSANGRVFINGQELSTLGHYRVAQQPTNGGERGAPRGGS
eukprot:scaffold4.g4819.t1